jgi:alkylation response protein AidB-like acyl-CoA dehydrogenase
MFVLGIFVWGLMGFGNVYYGLARRAFDMTVERVKGKKSIALARPSMAYHSGYQHEIAECVLDLEAIGPHLDRVAHDWSTGVNHGPLWPVKIVAAKCHAVEAAFRIVDRCLDMYGGFGIFPSSGIEQMFRDARLGRIHPASGFVAREICAKAMLGVDLDAQPR